MRVLVVCTHPPAPPHGGAALRTGGWLRAASSCVEIGVIAPSRSDRDETAMHEMAARHGWWVRTVRAPRTPSARLRDLVLSWLGPTPYSVLALRDRRLDEAVREALVRFRPQLVQAELLPAAQYLEAARRAGLPTVYSAHNVESRIVAGGPSAASRPWRRLAAARMRRHELQQAAKADAVVAVSTREASWLEATAPRVVIVPNALDLESYPFSRPAARRPGSLLFTGHLSYPPNRDAARLLARRIFPLVAREVPGVTCRIAGASPARDVLALADRGVEITPDFADFVSLSRGSDLFVSPLRWGAGSRLKLLEAAAVGLPIVTTAFGAEGLALEPERDYLTGSSPEELAAAVVHLLGDPERRGALARAARAAVEAAHDWRGQREKISSLYASLLGDSGPR